MATRPPKPRAPVRPPPKSSRSGRPGQPAPLPHDLPLFPENAPLDEKGEPVVRP
jgi:hypothetical protein